MTSKNSNAKQLKLHNNVHKREMQTCFLYAIELGFLHTDFILPKYKILIIFLVQSKTDMDRSANGAVTSDMAGGGYVPATAGWLSPVRSGATGALWHKLFYLTFPLILLTFPHVLIYFYTTNYSFAFFGYSSL